MSDDPLKSALRQHRVGSDQIEAEFTLPPRGPYEKPATDAQKNQLWKLGLQDRAVLDALGQDQADAVHGQIIALQQAEVAKIKPYKWPRRIFGWGALIAMIASMAAERGGADGLIVLFIFSALIWALLYMMAQRRLRELGLGGAPASAAQARAVGSLARRLFK